MCAGLLVLHGADCLLMQTKEAYVAVQAAPCVAGTTARPSAPNEHGGLTGYVKSRMSFHTMPACQSIFDGSCKGVAQMQRTRDIWRRDDHDELFLAALGHGKLGITRVKALCFPPILPGRFYSSWVITVFHRDLGEIFLLSFGSRVDKLLFGRSRFGLFLLFGFAPLRLGFLFLLFRGKACGETT